MSCPVAFFEVTGSNAGKLRSFYGDLFGWEYTLVPNEDYGLVSNVSGIPGGVGEAPEGPGWTTFYVAVQSLEEAVAKAESLGSKILLRCKEMPDVRIAMIQDPEGHPIGLVQQKS